jgi:hypothetical protein
VILIVISTALIAWTAVVAVIMAACANAGRHDRELFGAADSVTSRRDASPVTSLRAHRAIGRKQLSL